MNVVVNKLPKSKIEISIEVEVAKMQPHLEKAAQRISEVKKIPGFRPGKASLEAVKTQVGELELLNEAVEQALPVFLTEAIRQEKLSVMGDPYYDIENLKPGADLKFKATMSMIPEVVLGDYSDKKVKHEKIEITDEKVEQALLDLRKMRRSEALVTREAQIGDKVEMDLEISIDDKVLDTQKKMPVVLGDKKFIPGFEDSVQGMDKDETREFDQKFPKEYYNKELAGKMGHFKVKLLSVFEMTMPEANDEFAKVIGNLKNMAELKESLKKNLIAEAERQETTRLENEIVKILVDGAQFGEIPELLINKEVQKLMQEMHQSLAMQGIQLDDHLKQLGKKESELALELTPKAQERVKTSLVLRQFVYDKKIVLTKEEFEAELEKMKKVYSSTPDMLKQIETPQHKEYLSSNLLYQKVINLLKSEMVAN